METKQSGLIQAAEEALEEEKVRLSKEREGLSTRIQLVDAELKRVLASLAALHGESKSRSRAEAGDLRPSLADADASHMVEEILSSSAGPLQLPELKAKLLELCHERKILGTGVHLVLRRVLSDERFAQSKEGYALRRVAG